MRDRRWERFKRSLGAPTDPPDADLGPLDRRGLMSGHDDHSHTKGGTGHLEARDYGAFVDHRPPWLGPTHDSHLMQGVPPYGLSRRLEHSGPPMVPRQLPPRDGRPAFRATRSDERIYEDVCESLAHEGWLDASEIEVKVTAQRVTLEGEVSTREQKWLAEDISEHVLGVTAVINRLKVRREDATSPEPEVSRSSPDMRNGRGDGQRVS